MKKPGLMIVLVLLLGGGALVTLGKMDHKTDLSAVLEMWGDALRDTDEVTLQATRVSDRREMQFGQEIRLRLPSDDPAWTPYVNAVGQTMAPYVRRTGIRYQFHAIDSPEVNAFAVPGGHVERREAIVVPGVDVGSEFEEDAGDMDTVVVNRSMKEPLGSVMASGS